MKKKYVVEIEKLKKHEKSIEELNVNNDENEYNSEQVKIAEKMFDLVRDEYNSEYERIDRIESKIATLLNLTWIIIVILGAFQTSLVNENLTVGFKNINLILTVLAMLFLGGGVVLFLLALTSKRYIRVNLDTELNVNRFDKSYGEVVHQMVSNFRSYTEKNRKIIDKKVKYFKIGLYFISSAFLLVIFKYIVIYIFEI